MAGQHPLVNVGRPNHHPHLISALFAMVLAGVAVVAVMAYCERIERRYIHALAPEFTNEKLQGVVLQKHAFAQSDLLVLYGSSELVQDLPTAAAKFFHDYPTGFRVFPVGQPGTTALAVLQKVAAVGPDIRGRKVAYSISPGIFFYEVFDPKYYEGNFSVLQAYELAFSTHLSRELKRDIARRMLEFPKTLDDDWLLETTLQRLASDHFADRALYSVLRPIGFLNNAIGRAQDHVEATLHILDEDETLNLPSVRGRRVLNWSRLVKGVAQLVNTVVEAKRNQVKKIRPKVSRDKGFIETIGKAKEWTDAELLLRTFQELGAKPLLLSMPLEDIRLEAGGWSPAARAVFVERMHRLAKAYNFPLLDFREHEHDPGFLADFFDHLSAKGWLYYDQALDDFYHDRAPATAPPAVPVPTQ